MGHEVFPSIFHNMQEPQQYMSVVAIAFSVMQVSYAAIASLGYLAYGNHAQGNVVQNLPPGEVLTVVVHVCVLLAVLTKLCFVTAPLTEGVMEWVQLTDYLMRRSKQFKKIVGKPTRSWSPAQSLKGTYGTMPLTDAEEKPAGNMALDLARPADRQQYFQAQPDQFTPEKARQPAGSRDTALLDAPPLQTRRSSLSFTTATERIPDPDAASRPSFSWSATIPIPAIRSPSCEALPLFAVSSSVGSLPRSAGVLDLLLLQAKNQPGAAVNPDPAVQSVPQSLSALVGGMNAVDAEWGADSSSVDLSSPDSSIDSLGYKHSSFSPRKPHGTSTTLPAPPPSVRTALLYHKYHQHCRAATPCSLEQGPTAPQPHKESTIMNSEQLARFAVRTAVPLLAVAVSLLFHCFASMVVFVGGVCGGTISIVIPCLTYLSIHKHRLGGTERCATWGLVAAGGVLVLATFVAFAL